jgi:hypothetical protein
MFEKFESMSLLCLIHLDPAKPFIVETNVSDFVLGAILSQFGINGLLHPVAFYSRKLTSAEINYHVYDNELLAIIMAFEQWRPYLAGAQHQVQVLTDHKNLLLFHNYLDLELSPGMLVYLPS